jgi:multidrug efflux pump subunit AcrA (membrane-fusion protein)
MKTYERNMADTSLIVKNLIVLDKIDNSGIKEIRKNVEAVKKQAVTMVKQQEEYWTALSDDGIISVIEKQNLKREIENIRQSYAAVTQQAATLGYSNPILQDYTATYNALRTYLYDTLKLFDDMSVETKIPDRTYFNELFSNYFFMENFVLLAITKGVLDTISIRVLESLDEEGEDGEIALYRGAWYQHVDGNWKNITTGSYKGAKNELPETEEGSFFLASETFVMIDTLYVNGEELYVNGDILGVTNYAIKGYIYYCTNGVWYREDDKTNWRYAAAFADVINVTGELPQLFQDAIDDLQDQITDTVTSLQQEIAAREGQYTIINGELVQISSDITNLVSDVNDNTAELEAQEATLQEQAAALLTQAAELEAQGQTVNEQGLSIEDLRTQAAALAAQADAIAAELATKISHLPAYLGVSASTPSNPGIGDFYVFSGSGTNYSKIKRWTGTTWEVLEATIWQNRNYYMMALADILSINAVNDGYFGALFCQSIFANQASINTLETRTLYLRQGGAIQSAASTYQEGQNGLKIDDEGNIDANGDMHIGATGGYKVAIGVSLKNSQGEYQPDFANYNTVIGGSVLIKGNIKVQNVQITGDSIFSGDIESGPLILNSETPTGTVYNYPSGSNILYQHQTSVYGHYKDIIFDEFNIFKSLPYSRLYLYYKDRLVLQESQYANQYYTGYTVDADFSYETIIKEGSKTFILKDLPTQQPNISGCVWRDGTTLRITP